jgi:hypothetical protein
VRWALVFFAAGCLDSTAISFEPDPSARTTVFIDEAEIDGTWRPIRAFVFDHDTQVWNGLPLNVGRDDRLFALAYRESIAALQLPAGVVLPDSTGERTMPEPDIGARLFGPRISGGEWMDAIAPEFLLPAYSMAECIDDGLCIAARGDEYCTACTSSVAAFAIAPPAPADVAPFPPLSACPAGSAHFLGTAGCAPVGSGCPTLPGVPVVTDAARLMQEIAAGTATVALAESVFDLPSLTLSRPIVIVGCGPSSILRLAGELELYAGPIVLRKLRIEGGTYGMVIIRDVDALVEDVSIDGAGQFGVVTAGRSVLRRVSIEGRVVGVGIFGGSAIVDGLAVQNAVETGLVCFPQAGELIPTADVANVAMLGTPTNDSGRGIQAVGGCTLALDRIQIEGGRRAGIEAYAGAVLPRISNVTIRDLSVAPTDGTAGGILTGSRARIRSLSKVWIENVSGSGIEIFHPAVTIEDVHIENVVARNRAIEPYGLIVINPIDEPALAASVARVEVSGVAGVGLLIEAIEYTAPPTRATVSDVRIDALPALLKAPLHLHGFDVEVDRVHIIGGTDGLHVENGSQARLRDIVIEDCLDRGMIADLDGVTEVEIDRIRVSRCRVGLSVFARAVVPPDRALELRARQVESIENAAYGVIVVGAIGGLDDFVLRGNDSGIGITPGSDFRLNTGEIANSQSGARLGAGLDPLEILIGVRFIDNVRGLETNVEVP